MPPLVLLDIDGTLLLGAPRAHTTALADAMTEVWGVAVADEDIRAIGPAGRTDQEIARAVLRGKGVDDAAISAGLPAWMLRAVDLFPTLDAALPPPAVAPGAREALDRMASTGARLALLTGNLEPIGHAKLARAGLGGLVAPDEGAFGSDHEDRLALVPIARRRAGLPDDAPAVVIGDTPRDVACARAGGARVIAVTTGPAGAEALGAADAVVDDLLGAAEALARLVR